MGRLRLGFSHPRAMGGKITRRNDKRKKRGIFSHFCMCLNLTSFNYIFIVNTSLLQEGTQNLFNSWLEIIARSSSLKAHPFHQLSTFPVEKTDEVYFYYFQFISIFSFKQKSSINVLLFFVMCWITCLFFVNKTMLFSWYYSIVNTSESV